jgi:hypothetical protein
MDSAKVSCYPMPLLPECWYRLPGHRTPRKIQKKSNIYTSAARAIAPPSIATIGRLATAFPVAVAEALAGEALLYAVELPDVLVGEAVVDVLVLDDAAER